MEILARGNSYSALHNDESGLISRNGDICNAPFIHRVGAEYLYFN